LKERENIPTVKQLKLKEKALEKVNLHLYLLKHFDKELAILQEGKPGSL
jgi:hypothetical protein